jgi:hypothetical protein
MKLKCDKLLSRFASNFELRRYIKVRIKFSLDFAVLLKSFMVGTAE